MALIFPKWPHHLIFFVKHLSRNFIQEVNFTRGDEEVGILKGGPLKGKYEFLEFHFHWGPNNTTGAEHTLNGETLPLELHIVFQKIKPKPKTQKLAVTGFFFNVSVRNSKIFTCGLGKG